MEVLSTLVVALFIMAETLSLLSLKGPLLILFRRLRNIDMYRETISIKGTKKYKQHEITEVKLFQNLLGQIKW